MLEQAKRMALYKLLLQHSPPQKRRLSSICGQLWAAPVLGSVSYPSPLGGYHQQEESFPMSHFLRLLDASRVIEQWNGQPSSGSFSVTSRCKHQGWTPSASLGSRYGHVICNRGPQALCIARSLLSRTLSTGIVGQVHFGERITHKVQGKVKLDRPLRVFIVAGEPSGDAIGGPLMAAIRQLGLPGGVEFSGVGGPKMAAQGLHSLIPLESLAVLGIVEVIPAFLRIWAGIWQTTKAALIFNPDVIITIDAKGFCLRLLRKVQGLDRTSASDLLSTGSSPLWPTIDWSFSSAPRLTLDRFPLAGSERLGRAPPICIHYVPPSIWAWKGKGVRWLKRAWRPLVDHMLCILPLEVPLCREAKMPATFVGHPVIEDAIKLAEQDPEEGRERPIRLWNPVEEGRLFRIAHGLPLSPHPPQEGAARSHPVVCLLPGSRCQEVQKLLPIFQEAISVLAEHWPGLRVVIPTIGGPVGLLVASMVKHWQIASTVVNTTDDREKYAAFAACDVALAASGTVSLQLLLAGVPAVVAYRTHWLTEVVAQKRAAVPHIALPNILLKEEIIPEAIFAKCTPARLASLLGEQLSSPIVRQRQADAAKRLLPHLSAYHENFSTTSWGNPEHPKDWLTHAEQPSRVAASVVMKYVVARYGNTPPRTLTGEDGEQL